MLAVSAAEQGRRKPREGGFRSEVGSNGRPLHLWPFVRHPSTRGARLRLALSLASLGLYVWFHVQPPVFL